MGFSTSGKHLALLLAVGCLFVGSAENIPALAKKKAAAAAAAPTVDPVAQAEAELKKNLDPVQDKLTKLMMKVQGRALLSPADAGELVKLKYQLLDFINQYPQSAQLTKPLYQAGVLFGEREEYNDSYEMFNYLAQAFPTTTYGAKAKGQIQQLEKRFGANYFAVEASTPPPGSQPTATAAATPGATPSAPAAAATAPAAPAKK